jgi:hypothetical protein
MLSNKKVKAILGQHLRRHHEVRHHRHRHRRCRARGEAVGTAGGAHEGHQRRPGQEDPQGLRLADHLGRQHGGCGEESRRGPEEEKGKAKPKTKPKKKKKAVRRKKK